MNIRKCPNCNETQKLFNKKYQSQLNDVWYCKECNVELTRPKWFYPSIGVFPLLLLFQREYISNFFFKNNENEALLSNGFIFLVIIITLLIFHFLTPIKLKKNKK